MGGKLRRLATGAAWWVFEVLVSMLLGAAAVGGGGLILGLLSDGVGALQALQVGGLVGAGLGAIVVFGPGFATWGTRERTGGGQDYRPTGRGGDQG